MEPQGSEIMVKGKCRDCGIIDELSLMHKCNDGDYICTTCLDTEKVWDKWRNGKVTHDQVQDELTTIFPPVLTGFFTQLKNEIQARIHDRVPMEEGYPNVNKHFHKLAEAETKIVKTENFITFFEEYLTKINDDDLEALKKLDNENLTEYHVLIFRTLMDMAKSDMEKTNTCTILHALYKLSKAEMVRRGLLKNPNDAFEEFLQDKDQIINQAQRLEQARKTGKFCPYCNGFNVIKDGHAYVCKDCKKAGRKPHSWRKQ